MKASFLAAATAIVLNVLGCSGDMAGGAVPGAPAVTAPGGAEVSIPGASEAIAPERAGVAGSATAIGFNNAAQVVTTADGVQHYVFITGGRTVVHGSSTGSAGAMTTGTVSTAEGRASLTAIAATEDVIVVGWTETPANGSPSIYLAESLDGGTTWSAPRLLEAGGTALSLAADDGTVVAAWSIGDETRSEIHFAARDVATGEWPAPRRIDGSDAAPLWPAIDISDGQVWVMWRDNRSGPYQVYLRRSVDGGVTWLEEQVMARPNTGDPTVCAGENGTVWLAYHGRGDISVVRSTDGGETFGAPVVAGHGWFARLSCDDGGAMVLGWEQSEGMDPKSDITKQAVYVTGSADGEISGVTVLSEAAGTCASVTMRGDGYADAVWVDKASTSSGAPALQGELWHAAFPVP